MVPQTRQQAPAGPAGPAGTAGTPGSAGTAGAPRISTPSNPSRNGLMLAVLLLGQFMCIVDVFVVNVAMPSIGTGLHASGASLQLVVGGYTIAYAMLLITGARVGDRLGRRRTYLAGVIIFTVASLGCALAPDSQVLVAFRFVQGAGAAAAVPQVFSIIQLTFTGQARAKALSAYAAVLSAGAVTGMVLGGVVVTANLFGAGWRPVFAINVPLGIVLACLIPRLVPPDQPHAKHETHTTHGTHTTRGPRLDLSGLIVAVPAVLLVVLPLVLGREAGWPPWCPGAIAAGAVLAVVFVRVERRVAVRGGDPLLNLDVLRTRALPSGLAALVFTQVGYGGLLFAFTLHLQSGLGQSPLRAGLTYLPLAVPFGVAGLTWRRLPAGIRRVLVPVGLAVTAVAYLGIAVGVRGAGALVWAGLAAAGAGLGLSVGPLLTQSLAHVPAARAADASGLLTTTVQLGQLMGVAAIGSVYLSRAGSVPGASGTTTAATATNAATAAMSSVAMSTAAYWLAALSALGLVAAMIMVRAAASASTPRPSLARRSSASN
jgi:MFS family permease